MQSERPSNRLFGLGSRWLSCGEYISTDDTLEKLRGLDVDSCLRRGEAIPDCRRGRNHRDGRRIARDELTQPMPPLFVVTACMRLLHATPDKSGDYELIAIQACPTRRCYRRM